MKVLVATEKPFAKVAVDGIRKEIEAAGYELALLEKYTDKAQLLDAVKDANAIIIRSDIIDAEVLDAAKELKIVVRAGAGYDNVDLAAATAHNVCVMNTPGQNSNAVAELAPLDSVFNLLNGNHGKSHYEMRVLNPESDINYPTNQPVEMDKEFYQRIITAITESLKGITLSEEYLNSLLSVLEANLSYIPSSTAKKEVTDISLYDHVKITAAVASCVQQYLEEKQEHDFKKCLLRNAKKSYEEEMFLMYSMDISGIQKFIYTVGQKGADREGNRKY